MSTQKALYLSSRAGKWSVGNAPIPSPGPRDVLVKIQAAALNPLDWKIVDSQYTALAQEWPFISGTDGAGIVEEVGSEVTTLSKGDRILFQGFFQNHRATFQQYCIVPASTTAKIPDNISFDEAASVPLGLTTAVFAFYNLDPKEDTNLRYTPPWEQAGQTEFAGKPILIIGGSSSVGQYAIQLAKLAGFSPILTTASTHNTALLTSLGATHVLSRSLAPSALLSALTTLTSSPLELVFDAIASAPTQALGARALAPGGVLIHALPELLVEPATLLEGKRASTMIGNVFHPANDIACGEALYARLHRWLAHGLVKPNRVEVLPGGLAGIPAGLARLEADKVSGTKLVARPQETV